MAKKKKETAASEREGRWKEANARLKKKREQAKGKAEGKSGGKKNPPIV